MTLLNETQIEQLKVISGQLRQVRQEKSLLIEEIAARTLIRPSLLQALEAEQFADLPEPIFIQGFIRRYGDALGLDGNALAHTFLTNDFRLDPNKNLAKKSAIHLPLFVIYVLLLIAASAGLLYILNPPVTAESLTPEGNTQRTHYVLGS